MRLTEWRRACVLLVTAGAILTITNRTHADEPRYRVELHAPKYLPNCNDSEGFAEELDLALGHSLLDEANASRVLEVRIERPNGSEYAVDVVIKDVDASIIRSKTMRFPGSMECFKVLHKVAFVAAIEMEKDLPDESAKRVEPAATQPAATLVCPTLPAPPRCPEPVVAKPAPPQSPPRKRGFVGLGLGAFQNVAPEAFFAPQVRLGWYVRPRVVLGLDATGQAWTTTRPQDGPTILDVKTALATFSGCYVLGAFMACGLLATEVRHASGFARAKAISETRVIPLLGIRASFDHQLVRSLSVRTNIDALVYPSSREISGDGAPLWKPIPLALGVTTLLVWTF